jgi:hypothetical protein
MMDQSTLFDTGRGEDMSTIPAQRMKDLLFSVGDLARCGGLDKPGCASQIIWVRHKDGRKVPYDLDGTNHFKTCPNRDNFKRG